MRNDFFLRRRVPTTRARVTVPGFVVSGVRVRVLKTRISRARGLENVWRWAQATLTGKAAVSNQVDAAACGAHARAEALKYIAAWYYFDRLAYCNSSFRRSEEAEETNISSEVSIISILGSSPLVRER